ncbi:MAG TPA: prephenate dehydrogenase/arogenate dehydrogenase family protein, partial [Anaerolineales bacterium]|nr:prephenate dehydrogenase/arogenate dehydrogenase family protein [Anaerolineales bacterium]
MEDGFRLQDSKIAIFGLGLMGGSLALALKGKCTALYGIDSDPSTLKLALDKKIVDEVDTDPVKILPQADLVILATPVPVILAFIQKLPSFTQNPCIVIDLGSTKKDIVQAMSTMPERFDVLGGHPICGKEKLGLE